MQKRNFLREMSNAVESEPSHHIIIRDAVIFFSQLATCRYCFTHFLSLITSCSETGANVSYALAHRGLSPWVLDPFSRLLPMQRSPAPRPGAGIPSHRRVRCDGERTCGFLRDGGYPVAREASAPFSASLCEWRCIGGVSVVGGQQKRGLPMEGNYRRGGFSGRCQVAGPPFPKQWRRASLAHRDLQQHGEFVRRFGLIRVSRQLGLRRFRPP